MNSMVLNLTDISSPKASEKMIMVLGNLHSNGFISDDILMESKDDFFLASELIDKYQAEMHAKIRAMEKRSGNNPQANLYYISQIIARVGDEMSFDAHSSGYGYEYDNDPHSWGTCGEIHCSDDM